jgi:hypothetical protein
MTEQQISNRGREAALIVESATYQEAMQLLRESIVSKWKEVSLRDKEGQVLTLQMMKLADTFESLMTGFVEAGKFADSKIELDRLRDESSARKIMRRIL